MSSFLPQDGECSSLLGWFRSWSGFLYRCLPGKFKDSYVSSHVGTAASSSHLPLLGHTNLEAGFPSTWLPLLGVSLIRGRHIFMIYPGLSPTSWSQHVLMKCGSSGARVSLVCGAIAYAGKPWGWGSPNTSGMLAALAAHISLPH